MFRTWVYSLAGAGIVFLVAVVIVRIVTVNQVGDMTFVTLLAGVLLFGAGAVAGAIIGGVADLIELFKKREQAREPREQRGAESNP